MYTAWLFRQSAWRAVRERNDPRDPRFHWSRETVVPLTILALFLGVYVALILVGEDFAWYDDSQFTTFSLRGIDFPPTVWPEGGRFWPLGLQEFNLIGHFTKTAAGYHAFPIMEVLALASVLLILDDQLSIAGRAVLTILALFTPSVAASFAAFIYPERNVLLLLAFLALFVKLFEQTHSAWWAVAAVVSAQIMLYLKEPVFLLLLSFAAARLLLRSRNSNSAGWDFHRLRDEESRLDLCIAAVSLVFLAYYAMVLYPYTSMEYLVIHRRPLGYYIQSDLLAWVFAAVAVVRIFRIFRGTAAPLLLWDALACGGVVYFGAYLGIRIVGNYYLAPVDLIAVLYLGHLLFSSWGKMRLGMRIAAAAVLAAVVCQNFDLSVVQELSRKYVIHQKAAIARTILEKYQRDPALTRKLYFPFTQPYLLSEFAAYLSYRGVPLEEVGSGSMGGGRVEIFGTQFAKDGRCVAWRTFVCHAGAVDAGSLVVVLPDDPASIAERKLYVGSRERLPYDPPPHVAKLLIWVLNRVRSQWAWRMTDYWQGADAGVWK